MEPVGEARVLSLADNSLPVCSTGINKRSQVFGELNIP